MYGEVMMLEDGSAAEVTPLAEDRGALASVVLSAVITLVVVACCLV